MEARRRRAIPYLLALAAATLLSSALFLLGYQYDNKYTYPRHPAGEGVTTLNTGQYARDPFLFLLDGWAFYRDALLTPEQAAVASPDAYFYIGRYAGFDLGDAGRSPHGKGTYRMVIQTGGQPRDYSLELPVIYSRYRLWVNGTLMQSAGFGEAGPASDRIVFFSEGDIEIVVAVEDENGLYSGMVYPPAFGSPQRVSAMLSTRLLIHATGFSIALLVGLLCLLIGFSTRFTRPYGALFLLCACLGVFTTHPFIQAFGWGGGWALAQRFAHYLMFAAVLWLQARLCNLPKKLARATCGVGALVCLAVLIQPMVPVTHAGALYAFGNMLALYKLLCAAYLIAAGVWAAARQKPGSRALLLGLCSFGCALVIDRAHPLYEPILLGWPVELAGALLAAIVAGLLWRDTARVYRDNAILEAKQKLSAYREQARAEYARLSQEYLSRTERLLHETRNHLVVLKTYNERGERDKLSQYIGGLLEAGDAAPLSRTENELVNAILETHRQRAQALGAYVELELDVPKELSIEDADLSAILMNLLDNALCAAEKLPERERWLRLAMRQGADGLTIDCANGYDPEQNEAPRRGHGHGLRIMGETAEKYGGDMRVYRDQDVFFVEIHIPGGGDEG